MEKKSAGRDPRRIKVMLEKLEKLWLDNTDMRLGQLISNVAMAIPRGIDSDSVFYIEDDKLEEAIDKVAEKGFVVVRTGGY